MIDKKTLKKIKDLGLKIDWDDSFGGKTKGSRHLFRIAKIAEFLAWRLQARTDIAIAGAWLHDTALPTGDDYNYDKNKKIALRLLKQFKLNQADANAVAECVASHEGTVKPKTLEAKIVHDADVLEKSGILGLIRQTWKIASDHDLFINKKVIKEIRAHIKWRGQQLQTKEARLIYKRNNVKITSAQAEEVIKKTSELVRKGLITEKIAIKIMADLNAEQRQALTEQLSLKYLKEMQTRS